MTKAVLNKSVKSFAANIEAGKIDPFSEQAKLLFETLHNADNSFKSFTAQTLIIMIVLNRKYHFMNANYFGPTNY